MSYEFVKMNPTFKVEFICKEIFEIVGAGSEPALTDEDSRLRGNDKKKIFFLLYKERTGAADVLKVKNFKMNPTFEVEFI